MMDGWIRHLLNGLLQELRGDSQRDSLSEDENRRKQRMRRGARRQT